MSAKLQHNPSIALKTIGAKLKQELDNALNFYAMEEFRNIKVSTANFGLTEELPKLINAIKKDGVDSILPHIIVARGKNINTEFNKRLDYGHKVNVELVNVEDSRDKIFVSGVSFAYEQDIQFLLLTHTSYASQEIQLELKRILNIPLAKINYSIQIIRGELEDKGILYRTDDYASVELLDFGTNPFEYQKDEETGVYASYITGKIRTRYFKLQEDNNMVKRYEISAGFGDGSELGNIVGNDGIIGAEDSRFTNVTKKINSNWVFDK
jgi:hypothetical protein